MPFACHRLSLGKSGIRLVSGDDDSHRRAVKCVPTKSGTYEADFLPIALGAVHGMAATSGRAQHGNEFPSDAAVDRLRDIMPRFSGGRVIVDIPSSPKK
jgi:sulfide:quinone oxidoreductase